MESFAPCNKWCKISTTYELKYYLNKRWLTHWVAHVCISKITIIGSENGLSPDRCKAIIWTNTGILLIGPLGISFSEILTEFYIFSFKQMHLKMPSGKWWPFCLWLNVLSNKYGRKAVRCRSEKWKHISTINVKNQNMFHVHHIKIEVFWDCNAEIN